VIAFYGYRAQGDPLALARVILICAAASTTGTLVPYFIARRWGLPVAHRFAGWLDVDTRSVDTWIERVHRYGFRGVLVGRLIPGLRVAMSLVAGTAEVPMSRFSAGVFVAAAIYWTGWVLLGALVGPQVDDLIEPYVGYIAIGIPVVFITLFVLRVMQVRRRKR
jgi:membrane protein DedA with SNARE-associated domain